MITLDHDRPLNNLVSPPLVPSAGVVPLTIISVIPDIIQVRWFSSHVRES